MTLPEPSAERIAWRSRGGPAADVLRTLAVLLPFAGLLAYFHGVDVYDDAFFVRGVTLAYNLCRCLFIIYLFAAVCAPGYVVLRAVGGAASFAAIPPLARLAAAFFGGASLWHVLLLGLGFLDLYRYPVAVALSLPAVALAGWCLRDPLAELCADVRRGLRAQSRFGAAMTLLLTALVAAAALVLLAVKGLYPAGGHDYFNHYHGYYQAVLRTHGLWPNDVWYQFYYSKGLGLFFLGSLLTDPLAPSLVTYCFAVATALALFLMIGRMAAAGFWPWVAVIAFFAFYAYTPGTDAYLLNGGWADFQKPHEIGTAFVFGFLWLSAALWGARVGERRVWFAAAAGCILAAALVELVTVLLLGLFAALMTVAALALRRRREAAAFFGLSIVGGCGLVGMLVLNYAVTGLPSDQFVHEAWPWARLQTLAQWGVLPNLIILMQGMLAMRAQSVSTLSWSFVEFYHDLLRLDLLKPLLLTTGVFLGLLGTAMALRAWLRHRAAVAAPLWILLLFLIALAAAAAAAGINQRISFYRYTSFCLPVMIALAGCGWLYIAAAFRLAWIGTAIGYLLPLVLLAVALSRFWEVQAPYLKEVVPNALAFADGRYSIEQAYANQQGWAGRHEWGGIFPGMIGAWRTAGPGTRIWSMHLATYCMLPQCRAETFYSFILSPHLLDLLTATPEDTRATLQREGLDYFFFTTAMDMNDILPLTPLFAPEHIARHLGIKWTDGTSYLLTWLGPGIAPLSPEWVARYQQAVDTAPYQPASFPLALMLDLRAQMRGNPRWGRELDLPGIAARQAPAH